MTDEIFPHDPPQLVLSYGGVISASPQGLGSEMHRKMSRGANNEEPYFFGQSDSHVWKWRSVQFWKRNFIPYICGTF